MHLVIFNLLGHEIPESAIPPASSYSIIDFKEPLPWHRVSLLTRIIRHKFDEMANLPEWIPFDKVYILAPLANYTLVPLLGLTIALAGANIFPILWLEINQERQLYVDLNMFYVEGLDFMMANFKRASVQSEIEQLNKPMLEKEENNGKE